jgi:hypothetical protein
VTNDDIPAELWVKDMSGERQAVPRLETSQPFKTLGVHLGPDGSQLAAYEYLLETAKTWADKLPTSFLKEKEANAALKTTILKSWNTRCRLSLCRKSNATILCAQS